MMLRIHLLAVALLSTALVEPAHSADAGRASRGGGKASSTTVPAAEPTAYLAEALSQVAAPAAAQPFERPTVTLGRVILDLLLVLALLGVFLALLRWFSKRRGTGTTSGGGRIRVVDAAHLAPKKTVYLVEVADRMLVVGSAGDDLTLLSEITDRDAVEKLRGAATEPGEGFLTALSGLTKRFQAPPEAPK